ncbi:MAG TPA: GntR family transcriptional regulator [Firmicutes bacterium]|jgi:GntR family transcriptional regulator|nr:GntR family transcriptional regulator [Bacillota bacterium]HBK67632.1 GntR family transcriptional regulator [Bacillota bacterium]HBT17253.1 GntR family transcriptional regulator [Bacillota bacterium]
MEISIDKTSGVPLYIQIKEQVKNLIQEEVLLPGEKMPPERELAELLEVSRNTVSTAFKELEQEGVLLVEQGRGTFIKEQERKTKAEKTDGRKEKVLRLIDLALEESLDLGFTIGQFIALATVRAREKEEFLMKARILFIDCNQEQLHNFAREFRENIQLDIVPLLLKEFLAGGTCIERLLKQVDLVVTTMTHLSEVTTQFENLGGRQEIVPVAAQPRIESLIRVTRFAGKGKIGLIALSPEFAPVVKRALEKIGVYDLTIDFTFSSNPEELEEFIATHDLLLVYSKRYREIKAIAGEKEIISYWHELDRGSITLIRKAIERLELDKGRRDKK